MKEDVLKDLPPKITQDYYCQLSPIQQLLYEDFAKEQKDKNKNDKSFAKYFGHLIIMILIMTINPGFGGQKFTHAMVDKVARCRVMIGDRPIHIQVDGGIDPNTAPLVAAAGADVLVAGSAVFRGGSVDTQEVYGANITALKNAANGAL